MKLKVKTQVQDDQVRVTAKSRDDLQAVIAAVRSADYQSTYSSLTTAKRKLLLIRGVFVL